MEEKAFYAIVVAIVIVGGVGIGIALNHQPVSVPSNSSSSNNGPYHLNLVEVMDENYNSTSGAQPIFYVLQNGNLASSANISLPDHTQIQITITSYDMGNASVPSQYLKVTGTVNDKVTVINGGVAMGDNTSQTWEANLSSFPASEVLHTFTILNGTSTLLNIPVVAGYTETATFYLNDTGTFMWQCEASCGTGSNGWDGPMASSGWMTGNVYVSQ